VAGDDHARFRHHQRDFDALFREHYAEIVRYLTARLGSGDDAADVAAEVFVAAWRGARACATAAAGLAWLYRVAANMASDRLRERMRGRSPPACDHAGRRRSSPAVADRDALSRALGRLPADQQLAVHLRLVEGYSFVEVGRVMGRSAGACQMLVLGPAGSCASSSSGGCVSRLPEREAARRLAEVLDGAEPGDADVATVARVPAMRRGARFDVALRDRGGARARPAAPAAAEVAAPHRRRRPGRRGRLAVALVRALPFTSGPADVEVQARALAALGGGGQVLSVAEEIRPGPGESFPTSVRTGWIDVNGDRQRWTQSVDGTIVAETLVDHGRVTRYDRVAGTAVIATSGAALASGCADSVDPIAFYRRALQAAGPLRTAARTIDGHRVFRVVLPVQRLADAVRIVQVATIDAQTYLPRRIDWREISAGGHAQTFAEIVIRDVTREEGANLTPGLLDLELPPGTQTTQLAPPGVPVRLLGQERLTLAQARALDPRPWWLGAGRGPLADQHRAPPFTGGTAVRIRYGPTTLWAYGRVIPPPLLGAQVPGKTLPLSGGAVGRFYSTPGGVLIGERSIPSGTVAVEAPENLSAYSALGKVRPVG
jgi:RNA polymerase sigma-70 factor (ECF subfamily)